MNLETQFSELLTRQSQQDEVVLKILTHLEKQENNFSEFLTQQQQRDERIEKQFDTVQESLVEVKEQLTRIENHIIIIRGRVVPIDLDGITPETKTEIQELSEEVYTSYVETPTIFDPRLETQYDPRPEIVASITCSRTLHNLKSKDMFRVSALLEHPNDQHKHKVVFGDFSSKFSKALWGYNFDGWYPNRCKTLFSKLQYYFFNERNNSQLVKSGRWT